MIKLADQSAGFAPPRTLEATSNLVFLTMTFANQIRSIERDGQRLHFLTAERSHILPSEYSIRVIIAAVVKEGGFLPGQARVR